MRPKDVIGDVLGWARCPTTNQSLYRGYTIVWYKPRDGILVSEHAAQLPPDAFAEEVYRFVVHDNRASPSETSPEQIHALNDLGDLPFVKPGWLSRAGPRVGIDSIKIG